MKKIVDGNLPCLREDILIDILKRLPVKSLIRFQCVCKEWKNLINNSSFIQEHLKYSTQQKDFLVFNKSIDSFGGQQLCLINHNMQVTKCIKVPSFRHNIIGSSNGLLCLHNYFCESFILWNPATREKFQVPHVETQHTGIDLRDLVFVQLLMIIR